MKDKNERHQDLPRSEWDRCSRCGAVLDRDTPRGPAGADWCLDCDSASPIHHPQERYFRFDLEPLPAVLGRRGPACDATGCDAPATYQIACELQGDRADCLACVDHLGQLSNRTLFALDSSVRVRFDGETSKSGQQ